MLFRSGNYVAPQNQELIREEYLKKIELKLFELTKLAEIANISSDEIIQMIKNIEEGSYE